MSITVQFDEFNRRPEQSGGFLCLGDSLFGRAVSAGFAARANHQMRLASGLRFAGDDAAAAKFDVVGMGAKGQQRRKFRRSSV